MSNPPKLTKKQISEAIRATPMDKLLGDVNLTQKQKEFARGIVLDKLNKTEAYRKAYPNSKAKPNVQSVEANKLYNNPKVNLMISQLEHANTLSNHIFSATSLRNLCITTISELAMDETLSAKDRLSALRMIGQFAEVSLFEDRKEHTIVTNSEEVKAKLLTSLRNAIASSSSLSQIKKQSAEELLQEIHQGDIQDAELIDEQDQLDQISTDEKNSIQFDEGDAKAIDKGQDPPTATPLNQELGIEEEGRTIPDKQSPIIDIPELEDEGVGGNEILRVELGVDIEMTPLDDLGSHS